MNASLIYITYRDRITQHVGMLGFLCFQNTQKLHSNLNNVKKDRCTPLCQQVMFFPFHAIFILVSFFVQTFGSKFVNSD